MRFLLVNTNKEFQKKFKELFLEKDGYVEINGNTNGDEDFICVDTLNKQWCYCENGFYPFNNESLLPFQFKDKDFKLKELVLLRY